ncbi:hypothetical protein MES5069_360039 [Mesorhizobium escarrei]|uniref:Uncharacterized protein n=1 Tax=Mesorhizobium escarrei TaxID=666018 RepID=A0ABM9E2G8_9HYPH|nr:hypothetical protein MES5069_360039 [Mesorhizobium escarrei]
MPLRNVSLCKPTEGRVNYSACISLCEAFVWILLICGMIENMDRQHAGPQELGAGLFHARRAKAYPRAVLR